MGKKAKNLSDDKLTPEGGLGFQTIRRKRSDLSTQEDAGRKSREIGRTLINLAEILNV